MLLEKHGVYTPDWNHIRAYMACAEPDAIGVIRFKRGFMAEKSQKALYSEIEMQLSRALERVDAKHLILSSGQLGAMLSQPAELERLGLPPLKWSSAMFRKTEETHGQQATKARRDCHEVTAG